jgi:LPXTG-motif cell wall-anchored protein
MNTTNNCTPGQGGAGGETPTPTPTTPVTELPQTGPADGNTALKLATIVFAGIATYGAMYVVVNRRSLLQK